MIDAFAGLLKSLKIKTASNGRTALVFLEELPDHSLPCLIILDYNLPEIHGDKLLEMLSRNTRYEKIPKVVWSTSNASACRQICMQLGATAYFVKPSTIQDIDALAKEMLSILQTVHP